MRTRPCDFPETRRTEPPDTGSRIPGQLVTNAHPDHPQNLEENGSTRRGNNVLLSSDGQHNGDHDKETSRHEECSPVTVVPSQEGGRDSSCGAPVDRCVEPVVYPLDGDGGGDNNLFARRKNSLAQLSGVLFGNHGTDIGLDSATSDTHDHNGEEEKAVCLVWVCDRRGRGRTDEDDMAGARKKLSTSQAQKGSLTPRTDTQRRRA